VPEDNIVYAFVLLTDCISNSPSSSVDKIPPTSEDTLDIVTKSPTPAP